jgi:hypothetical protein
MPRSPVRCLSKFSAKCKNQYITQLAQQSFYFISLRKVFALISDHLQGVVFAQKSWTQYTHNTTHTTQYTHTQNTSQHNTHTTQDTRLNTHTQNKTQHNAHTRQHNTHTTQHNTHKTLYTHKTTHTTQYTQKTQHSKAPYTQHNTTQHRVLLNTNKPCNPKVRALHITYSVPDFNTKFPEMSTRNGRNLSQWNIQRNNRIIFVQIYIIYWINISAQPTELSL